MSQGMHLGYPKTIDFYKELGEIFNPTSLVFDSRSYVWFFSRDKIVKTSWFNDHHRNNVDSLPEKDWKLSSKNVSWWTRTPYNLQYDVVPQEYWKPYIKEVVEIPSSISSLGYITNLVSLTNTIRGTIGSEFRNIVTVNKSTNAFTLIPTPLVTSIFPYTEPLSTVDTNNDVTPLYYRSETTNDLMDSNMVADYDDKLYMISAARTTTTVDDYHRLYRYNTNGNTWSYINLPMQKQGLTLNLTYYPPSNKLFVCCYTDFKILVINCDTFTVETSIPFNGWPVRGVYTKNHDLYFESFDGMVSHMNGETYVITHSHSSASSSIEFAKFQPGSDFLWLSSLHRINLAEKSIEEPFLSASGINTVNRSFTIKEVYPKTDLPSISNDDKFIITPKFDIGFFVNGVYNTRTIYPRIITISGDIFNTNDIEWVFDKPAVISVTQEEVKSLAFSYYFATAGAMVGSGDTDYRGEFT